MSRCLPLLMLGLVLAGGTARAQSNDMGVPDIMKPEPWTAPKYKSPRGTVQHPARPRVAPTDVPPRVATPPTLYVPQTGRTVPNLPTLSPSGPNGRETYQDRAVRCAHQAGAFAGQTGDRSAYINTCINQ